VKYRHEQAADKRRLGKNSDGDRCYDQLEVALRLLQHDSVGACVEPDRQQTNLATIPLTFL